MSLPFSVTLILAVRNAPLFLCPRQRLIFTFVIILHAVDKFPGTLHSHFSLSCRWISMSENQAHPGSYKCSVTVFGHLPYSKCRVGRDYCPLSPREHQHCRLLEKGGLWEHLRLHLQDHLCGIQLILHTTVTKWFLNIAHSWAHDRHFWFSCSGFLPQEAASCICPAISVLLLLGYGQLLGDLDLPLLPEVLFHFRPEPALPWLEGLLQWAVLPRGLIKGTLNSLWDSKPWNYYQH